MRHIMLNNQHLLFTTIAYLFYVIKYATRYELLFIYLEKVFLVLVIKSQQNCTLFHGIDFLIYSCHQTVA